jgi:serine/threonine-protein kinase RsbW
MRPVPPPANGRRAAAPRGVPVLRVELRLPRHAASVGVARRILDSVLRAFAVDHYCRAELLLALSEGCANAVQHAVGADEYDVRVAIDEECCVVDIVDNGRTAVRFPVNPSMPDVIEERGRGLSIIAMSTDSLQISPRRPHGLAVRFTKGLSRASVAVTDAARALGRPSGHAAGGRRELSPWSARIVE